MSHKAWTLLKQFVRWRERDHCAALISWGFQEFNCSVREGTWQDIIAALR